MKILEVSIDNLIPLAWGGVSEKGILEKEEKIKNGEQVEILAIPTKDGNKYYIPDGHHGVIGYKRLDINPHIVLLENNEDLKKYIFRGAIDTTNLNLLQERCYEFFKNCIKKGVPNFDALELLTT